MCSDLRRDVDCDGSDATSVSLSISPLRGRVTGVPVTAVTPSVNTTKQETHFVPRHARTATPSRARRREEAQRRADAMGERQATRPQPSRPAPAVYSLAIVCDCGSTTFETVTRDGRPVMRRRHDPACRLAVLSELPPASLPPTP